MISVRDKIVKRMKTKGWSIVTTADRSGVPLATIKSIIYGNSNNQRITTLEKLAKVFECSIGDLVNDEEPSIEDKKIDADLFKECLDAINSFIKKKEVEINKEKLMLAVENLTSLLAKKKEKGLVYAIDDEVIEWIIENTK